MAGDAVDGVVCPASARWPSCWPPHLETAKLCHCGPGALTTGRQRGSPLVKVVNVRSDGGR